MHLHRPLTYTDGTAPFVPVPQADHYDKGYTPRIPGERLSASYINHYKANGGAVLSKVCACVHARMCVHASARVCVCACVRACGWL